MKIIIALFLIFCMFIMCVFFDNKRIAVRKFKVSVNRNNLVKNKLKIVQLSDIHKKRYPQNWRRLILIVKNLEPDIIFITGDLVSRTEKNFNYKKILLENLCKICPVYCSKGNHELDLSDEVMDKYREMLSDSGAVLLENTMAQFIKENLRINIYGADLKKGVYRNEKGSYKTLDTYYALELKKVFGNPESFSILLAHNPFFFMEYAEWGADLTFSGHVHGGVVNTPFGGLLSPERKFFPKYTKGVYEYKGTGKTCH